MDLDRERYLKKTRRIVLKIGSSVLTDEHGHLSPPIFASIVDQIAGLVRDGIEVVLVSSGAIAAGRSLVKEGAEAATIPEKQALAAVGQPQLIGMYQQALEPFGKRTAQVLLTRDDLTHRRRYLNARNTLFKLLQFGILPVVNENDTVMVEEIKFGDNDNLSARVAILSDADLLVLLTDRPGLCTWKEGERLAQEPIPFIQKITPKIRELAGGPSKPLGTGGMTTKLEAARIATQAGLPVVIADGRRQGVLDEILTGKEVGTFVAPLRDRLTHRKHWIAYTLTKKGDLVLDRGAVSAIVEKGKSLLPSGIVSVRGTFENGDMVSCLDEEGKEWARGITHYASQEIEKIAGSKSSQIEDILGYRIQDEVIHRDELVVLKDEPPQESM